jgi:hypothetical protein
MGDSLMCTWSLELGAGTYNQNPIARGPFEPGPLNNLVVVPLDFEDGPGRQDWESA